MKKTLFAFFTVLSLACAALQPNVALAAGHEREPELWPMMPGESLRDLAALFYPKSKAMQQRFIAATLRLNGEALAAQGADQPFEQGGEILLPDLYELSKEAPKARKPAARKAKAVEPVAVEPAAGAGVPSTPVSSAEVSNLEQRNQQRRQELEQLNQRLRSLESEAAKMQENIQQNKAALPQQK